MRFSRKAVVATCGLALLSFGSSVRADTVVPPYAQITNLDSVKFLGSAGTGTFSASGTDLFMDFQTVAVDYSGTTGAAFQLTVNLSGGVVTGGSLLISGNPASLDTPDTLPDSTILFDAKVSALSYSNGEFDFTAISNATAFSPSGALLRGLVRGFPSASIPSDVFGHEFILLKDDPSGPSKSYLGMEAKVGATAVPLPNTLYGGLALVAVWGGRMARRKLNSGALTE